MSMPKQLKGADLIRAERERQISEEGYSSERDKRHITGTLIEAAIAYSVTAHDQVLGMAIPEEPPATWPWCEEYWNPSKDKIRNLVKAGALIAAEIDRLTALQPKEPHEA